MAYKLFAIVTEKSGVFVALESGFQWDTYGDASILYFDGVQGEPTFEKAWVRIPALPSVYSVWHGERTVLTGWDLDTTKATPSESFPLRIEREDQHNIDEDVFELLYNPTHEKVDGYFKEVVVEVFVIAEREDWAPIRSDFKPRFSLIDQISVHGALLQEKPCSVDSAQLYKMVRSFVQANINPKLAVITSDYDFCFTVQKRIELVETESYRVDVSRTRRPRYETRFRTQRQSTVFECAPKPYQNYTVLPPISAGSQRELNDAVDAYLKELIEAINEPVKDCPACRGRGVVLPSK